MCSHARITFFRNKPNSWPPLCRRSRAFFRCMEDATRELPMHEVHLELSLLAAPG